MDMVFSQFPDRLSALEQENAILRSRLQTCEQSHALLQAELAIYRRGYPDPQDQHHLHTLKRCLLEATATVANTLFSIPDFDIAIKTALQILGEALETDRLIVAENFASPDSALPNWQLLYEWNSPGTVSQIVCPDLAQGSWAGIEAWYEQLSRGQSVVCFIEDMPEPFRRILVELGAKAIHSVPIFVEGQYWGQLGFDDCREAKRRSVVELSVLRIAADCIGSAIQQQRTQQSLLQAEQKRSQELECLNSELQQTLDRLAESEKRYRTLFELSNEGIYHFEFDSPIPISLPLSERLELAYRTNRLTEVNLAFAQQYGLDSPADIIGLRISDFYVEGSQKNRQTNEELLSKFQACNLETEEVDRFGNRRYFLSSVVCTVQGDKIINGWGIQKDITELREAQQALLQAEQERVTELERINVELQQTLDRLLKSEERFCTLFELSSEGFYYTEVDPPCPISLPIEEQCDLLYRNIRVVKANPAFAAMHGVAHPDELIGLRNTDVHVSGSDKNAAFIRGTIENGYRFRNLETEEIDTQGQQRYLLNSGVYTIRDGCVVSGWSTQVDITELRQTQQALLQAEQARSAGLAKANEELQQRDRLLSVVAQITKNLLEAEDLDSAIPAALQAVGEVANMSRVQLLLEYQDAATQTLQHMIAYEWVAEGAVSQIDRPDAAILNNDDFEFMLQDLYEGHSIWRIVAGFPNPIRAKFESIGVKSSGTVPIFIEGHYIGGVGFGDCITPRQWSQQEIDMLTAATESIGAALHRKQLVDRLIAERIHAEQERATELSRANTLLRNSLSCLSTQPNLNDVLGHLLVELVRYAGAAVGHIFIHDAVQDTLNLAVRCQDGQAFWTPAEDEPALFRSPIPIERTPIFTDLCAQPRLAILNQDDFEDRLWQSVPPWFQAKGYRGTCSCVLMIGDRPFGLLAMAFTHPVAFRPVEEELILALAHQATLAIQLTRLAEEAKQVAIFEERNRMAGEIHDTLAQVFTGISLQLEVAKPLVYQDPQTVAQILEHLSQLAETGLTEARRSVWALYPPAAEYADLAQMLYDSVEYMTRNTAVVVEVNVEGEPCPLPPLIGMNMLRIGQEALTNALKHAQAQTIAIELAYEPDRILLVIRDNGRGFAPPTAIDTLNGGFGLMGMYERCDRIGAQLSLISQPGQGTQILVEAPLN